MEDKALFNHPLFALAMYRATNMQLRAGKITQQQAGEIHDAFASPNRKNAEGDVCDVVDELHAKIITRVQNDPAVKTESTPGDGAFLTSLFAWLQANLPAIISDLEAIIAAWPLLA